MFPEFEARLPAFAKVIVRVGLNLQPGQRLLIAEPYELQGVARSAAPLVEAVQEAARSAGGGRIDVIWGDPARLHDLAARADWRGVEAIASANARRMRAHLSNGGAFLFLLGSQPHLLDGIPPARVNELHGVTWENFGPVVQKLLGGATQWTLAPAPSSEWADEVYSDLDAEHRLPALWRAVFAACRCDGPDPVAGWDLHLGRLLRQRDEFDARRLAGLRYVGEDTDLTVGLPRGHVWCTARQVTRRGVPYTVNLPTDEIFTAPDKASANGRVRVARPVSYGGRLLEGIELEFQAGQVVAASARTGADLLQEILGTDRGARRLGEVAVVPAGWADPADGRCYRHALLDENSSHHIALGSAYPFCHRRTLLPAFALNRSLIHLDLPLAVELREL
ncbi:MAG: aminopeptidase [Opitutales bacterium]